MTLTQLEKLYDQAEAALRSLSDTMLEGKNPPVGPHAFFYFNGLCLERLENCISIVRRLFQASARMTELAGELRVVKQDDWPAGIPYPEEVQRLHREERPISLNMTLDLESLYLFGRLLLDQWSLQAFLVAGMPTKGRQPFSDLVTFFDAPNRPSGVLDPLWSKLHDDFLWLYYQLRFYRNKIVVHPDRPWQRGSSFAGYGDHFRLNILTPPNWLDDADLKAQTKQMMADAPPNHHAALKREYSRGGFRSVLQYLFDQITNFSDPDYRRLIAKLFTDTGGSTPSFQALAFKFFSLVAHGSVELDTIASQNLSNIDLGAPFKTGYS